jgi:hypothetical protein
MIDYADEELSKKRDLATKEMRQNYRNVFGTNEGRKVLGDILALCHYGVTLANDMERIEYNIGLEIAQMSGSEEAAEAYDSFMKERYAERV